MLYYNFDQYLYTESEDSDQGIGVFGRFGWARQDVNPAAHFYSFGVSGKGIIPNGTGTPVESATTSWI